jgi:hypothetical protein
MIIEVWEPCGLVRAFEKNFQASPMKENAKCSLFASAFNVVSEEISWDNHEDWEDLFHDVEIMGFWSKSLSGVWSIDEYLFYIYWYFVWPKYLTY